MHRQTQKQRHLSTKMKILIQKKDTYTIINTHWDTEKVIKTHQPIHALKNTPKNNKTYKYIYAYKEDIHTYKKTTDKGK